MEAVHSLLDKEEQRRSMRLVDVLQKPEFSDNFFRVTYSDDFNFIVRFMQSAVHDEASGFWVRDVISELTIALVQNGNLRTDPGYKFIGTRGMFFQA